jgi:hypothetical protein
MLPKPRCSRQHRPNFHDAVLAEIVGVENVGASHAHRVDYVHDPATILQTFYDAVRPLQGDGQVFLFVTFLVRKAQDNEDNGRILGEFLDLRQLKLLLESGQFSRPNAHLDVEFVFLLGGSLGMTSIRASTSALTSLFSTSEASM